MTTGCVWNRRRRRRARRGTSRPQHQPPIRRSIRRACGSRFHGLQHGGPSRFSVNPACPNSGRFVFPTTIAPAPFIRSAGSESASAIRSLYSSEPIVCGIPCHRFGVLDRDRNPVQRAQLVAPHHCGLCCASRVHGVLRRQVQERVQLWFELVDPPETRFGQFDRRHFPGGDHLCQTPPRRKHQFSVVVAHLFDFLRRRSECLRRLGPVHTKCTASGCPICHFISSGCCPDRSSVIAMKTNCNDPIPSVRP